MDVTKKKHVVILGAGISGLTLAWYLKRYYPDQLKITVLEQNSRVGGWIHTIQHDGFLFELGPHSCRPRGTGIATLKLIEELELQDELIFADPNAVKRFLFLDQKLQKMPTTLLSFLFSPITRGTIPNLINELWVPRGQDVDETIFDFFNRRFGMDITEKFIDPLTSGVYAGDIKKLSLRSCFPQFHQWEQQHGSIIKGLLYKTPLKEVCSPFVEQMLSKGLFSFRSGMSTLPMMLHKKLETEIHLSSKVEKLKIHPNSIELSTSDNKTLKADHVISTLPANALALLLENYMEVSHPLRTMEQASLAIVSLGYNHPVLNQQGFGYLVPSKEREDILGIIWDSSVFPQQNKNSNETRLTVMLGGVKKQALLAMNDRECSAKALLSIAKHMKVTQQPDSIHIHKVNQAIPQYTLGHTQKIADLTSTLSKLTPHISLLGSSFFGVSVNDCIDQAEKKSREFQIILSTSRVS